MTKPEISAIAPFFIVKNVPAALSFYRDRLGFDIIFQGPNEDDIFFGIVRRGAAMIMVKAIGVDPIPNCTRDIKMGNARIETGMGSQDTSLFWVRLEFHETNLFAIDHLAVARLPLPPSLANYHGIIGRDLLLNWESLFLEGRRKRFTIRDSPRSLLDWFRLR